MLAILGASTGKTVVVSRIGWTLALLATVLTLSIFTHVVTCAPCNDDDICASARIDGAEQLSAMHTGQLAVLATKPGPEFSPPQVFGHLALGESTRELQPFVSIGLVPSAASWSAESNFSHPQTDVLLI